MIVHSYRDVKECRRSFEKFKAAALALAPVACGDGGTGDTDTLSTSSTGNGDTASTDTPGGGEDSTTGPAMTREK